MKITFQTKQAEQEKLAPRAAQTDRHSKVPDSRSAGCVEASFFEKPDKIWENKKGAFREKGKSLIELQQDAQVRDAAVQQDYMTVMSHTMSEKDYAKMEEEGFRFKNLDPETAVTIVDKIKAELVRSGENIVGYTDDLDMETLAAAVGSDSLARAISDSFAEADIPLTPENIAGVKKAWNMATELTPMEGGVESYLLDNDLEPEIWNLYLAENSGAKSGAVGNARYYAEDIQGYFAESAEAVTQDALQEQVEKVVVKAGLPVNEESLELGRWLLEKKLPLTAENLQRLNTLRQVKLPVTEEDFARAAANAIAEGKEPIYGNFAKEENLYQKAARLAARRQLEEVRLYMTAEVNVKLLKSGFSIDTAPMEELIKAYKEAEEQLANQYFPEDAKAVSKYENYCETNRILEELPQFPVDILGKWSVKTEQEDLSAFYEEGRSLKEAYEKAESSYEALGTAPRSDLGDSIRKAFGNVDAILEDLQLEITDENRRAVRILGYNRMELTAGNIDLVREADERVQFVIGKMTPASVLKMIRDDVNPLEKTLPELEEYFKALPEEYQERAESYSRFLYGLEKKSAITEEERESYIGVYRLLRQIEKSDGAAVGALLNTQAELHLKNILSAVRSGRFRRMDVRVSDMLGAAAEKVQHGESISEQIGKAFVRDVKELLTDVSYDEEAMVSYREQELSELRQAAFSDMECVSLLQKGQIPANADNLLVAQALLKAAVFYEKMKKKEETPLWEKLDDKESFAGEYERLTAEITKEAERLTEEADASVDVRNLQLLHKQLRITGKLAQSEEYFIPMDVGGELTRVHLVMENGAEEQGKVSIDVKLPGGEHIEAQVYVREHRLTALIAGNEGTEVTKLKEIADTFTVEASRNWTVEEIMVQNSTLQKNKPAIAENKEQTDNAELYRAAKVFLEAVKKQREVKYEN